MVASHVCATVVFSTTSRQSAFACFAVVAEFRLGLLPRLLPGSDLLGKNQKVPFSRLSTRPAVSGADVSGVARDPRSIDPGHEAAGPAHRPSRSSCSADSIAGTTRKPRRSVVGADPCPSCRNPRSVGEMVKGNMPVDGSKVRCSIWILRCGGGSGKQLKLPISVALDALRRLGLDPRQECPRPDQLRASEPLGVSDELAGNRKLLGVCIGLAS